MAYTKAERAKWRREWLKTHPNVEGLKLRRERTRERNLVLEHYTPRCNYCGYDKDLRALQLDHIHNDGWKHYQASKAKGTPRRAGVNLPKMLKRGILKWEDFQLLCANCNVIKAADILETKMVLKYGE